MLQKVEAGTYQYEGYALGQEVIVKGHRCKIIGISTIEDNNFSNHIAVNKYIGSSSYHKNISEAYTNGYYIEDDKNEYTWISTDMIQDVVKKEDECVFKIGQRVWDFSRGYGTVNRIIDDEEEDFPVAVVFNEGNTIYFTIDGRYYKKCNRTLFFEEIPIPESALIPKRWRADKGKEFYYINARGSIVLADDLYDTFFNKLYESGNYFQYIKEAENSDLYKVFQTMKERI